VSEVTNLQQWAIIATPVLVVSIPIVNVWVAKLASVEAGKTFAVVKQVHTLVNSQMGQQLQLYAITARTLANLTRKAEHIEAADRADAALAEHAAKQKIVDAGEAH